MHCPKNVNFDKNIGILESGDTYNTFPEAFTLKLVKKSWIPDQVGNDKKA